MTEVNEPRRRFLIGATSFVAGAGVVGVATPFVQSWNPSAKAKSVGAPVQVGISKIDPGAMITVAWQGKPVWVVRRTAENLKNLALEEHSGELRDPDSDVNQQPDYARNAVRSIRDDIFVAVGICTHLGCVPNTQAFRISSSAACRSSALLNWMSCRVPSISIMEMFCAIVWGSRVLQALWVGSA